MATATTALVAPDHLAEAKQLLDDTTAELEGVKEAFRQKANTLCRTMTPKESFEFRLRSEQFVRPGLSWNPLEEEEESEEGYNYTICFRHCYNFERVFMQFLEGDDRYTVNCGQTELPYSRADQDGGLMYVAFMPREPVPHMLVEKGDQDN
jgi:hypothetical protein